MNVLLGYMVGKDELPPREVVFALEILASRAFNRLQAGWSETSVRHQWPHAYQDADELGGGTQAGDVVKDVVKDCGQGLR